MKEIHFVDTTLRDGQLSLWASNMTTGMMLPIVENIDRAGFEGMELLSSAFFKKCVRDLKDDLWDARDWSPNVSSIHRLDRFAAVRCWLSN